MTKEQIIEHFNRELHYDFDEVKRHKKFTGEQLVNFALFLFEFKKLTKELSYDLDKKALKKIENRSNYKIWEEINKES